MIYTREKISSVNIDEIVHQKIVAGRTDELLVVVPTNRKLRDMKKKFITAAPGQTLSQIHLDTFTTFASNILTQHSPFIELSDAAAKAMIKESASEITPVYFRFYGSSMPEGTLDRIRNVISKYKKHGMTPDLLKAESDKLEKSEKLKAIDIANIYEKYLHKCKSLEAYEIGDVYNAVNNLEQTEFGFTFRNLFPNVNEIIVHGFDELTHPEIKLLNQISEVTGTRMYINFDYFNYNSEIFKHLEQCSILLEQYGFEKVDDASQSADSATIDFLKQNLFKNKSVKKADLSNKIFTGRFNSREDEIKYIATKIKTLITDENIEPHNICIVFNLVQNYSLLARDIFNRFGIPVNITDRLSVNSSFPVIAVFNFLEIHTNDFFHKSLFRALNNGFVSLDDVDVFNLQKAASELKLTSGRNNWKARLRTKIKFLQENPDEESNSKSRVLRYQRALVDIQKIERLVEPFEQELTPEEFFESVKYLITQLGIKDKIMCNGYMLEENVKALTAFLEMISEIVYLLKLEHGDKAKFPAEFYYDTIYTAASSERYNVKERPECGVTITSANEIRGLKYDYLFVGGMIDGDFPTRYNPEIFFSGSFRKKEDTHITEERYHFYQTLNSWNKSLYLTLPVADGGRETVESGFVKNLESVFKVTPVDIADTNLVICSEEDKQLKLPDYNNEGILLKKLEKEKIRINNSELNIYNGYVGSEAPVFDKSKQYSITQLELYAKCPFRFFLERVLKLKLIEEPTEDLESYELGNILHAILFKFYSELREHGITLNKCNDEVFAKCKSIMFKLAEKYVEDAALNTETNFLEMERILGTDAGKKNSVLLKFLEHERNDDTGFFPEYFEVGFGATDKIGVDSSLGRYVPVNIGNVNLLGKIDRIDINNTANTFAVVDYKLNGKKPSLTDLQNGLSLQLPVYAAAGKELLQEKGISDPEELIIYSLHPSDKKFGKLPVLLTRKRKDVDKTGLIENQIKDSTSYIIEYADNINSGKFPLTTVDDYEKVACMYCDFDSICRKNEVKKD